MELSAFASAVASVVSAFPRLGYSYVPLCYNQSLIRKGFACNVHDLKHPTATHLKLECGTNLSLGSDSGLFCEVVSLVIAIAYVLTMFKPFFQ